MSNDKSEPAFPVPASCAAYGMTVRDYFAAKAMQAIIHVAFDNGAAGEAEASNGIAQASYLMADAMLAERAK